MNDETAGIYHDIFKCVKKRRENGSLRSYTTLAYAEIDDESGEPPVVGSMNSAGGLVTKAFRTDTEKVQFFSVSSKPRDNQVISLEENGTIERSPNRHAEMNIVMFALWRHLAAGGTINNFRLDDYLISLNPSQNFCPECQLAIALLSPNGGRLISSISQCLKLKYTPDWKRKREQPDEPPYPTSVLRPPSGRMLSPNWAPPWAGYYDDIPGSDFFRSRDGTLKRQGGPYVIMVQTSDVVILEYTNRTWQGIGRIRRPSWIL